MADTSVFISSTCYDLLDLRAELFEHLKGLGLNPILSDHPGSDFVAEGKGDSIETCLVNLRKCEIVVVILDKRYGSPLPGSWAPLSATHVEFREAVKQGKRILFYVRDKLRGEYDHWRSNSKSPELRFRWVREKDAQQLFGLLEGREADFRNGNTGPEAADNWMWAFRDSVELKARIARDLQVESRRAVLQRLIREGAAPSVALILRVSHATPTTNLTFELANGGRVAAMNVKWGWSGSSTTECKLLTGMLYPGALSFKFGVAVDRPSVTKKPIQGELQVQYETPSGYVIQDLHTVFGELDMKISARLTSRQLVQGEPYKIL